jgi:hypothetical protein
VAANPKECITMPKTTKADPIFAAIQAHRQAAGALYATIGAIGAMEDGAPEYGVARAAGDKIANITRAATNKLRKTQPTTIAGVTAVTAYMVEYLDRYPDCGWVADPKTWNDPNWFEHGMIHNLAKALAQITGVTTVLTRS